MYYNHALKTQDIQSMSFTCKNLWYKRVEAEHRWINRVLLNFSLEWLKGLKIHSSLEFSHEYNKMIVALTFTMNVYIISYVYVHLHLWKFVSEFTECSLIWPIIVLNSKINSWEVLLFGAFIESYYEVDKNWLYFLLILFYFILVEPCKLVPIC